MSELDARAPSRMRSAIRMMKVAIFSILDIFFFQAEDGIRDHCVTGVQTCALPICRSPVGDGAKRTRGGLTRPLPRGGPRPRSEERRVGKECRSRWWREH